MMRQKPNVIVILADDLGYSDLGSYGGEIDTPNLNRLSEAGVRLTQFYNTARCSPSRASLLTGRHPHETGIGILTNDDAPSGYPGTISSDVVTVAEILQEAGYATVMLGKWHLTHEIHHVNDAWPINRGFDKHFGTLGGSGSYYAPNLVEDEHLIDRETLPEDFYYTDELSMRAANYIETYDSELPFFMYLAYTAPHWPLHAPEEQISKYDGRFDDGWDVLREERLERMKKLGVVADDTKLSGRARESSTWNASQNKAWEARRMQTYAAQVEIMDQGIGSLIQALENRGMRENTLIIFLSDNGASGEDLPQYEMSQYVSDVEHIVPHGKDGSPMRVGNTPDIEPGPSDTFASYGPAWANLSNTPFRRYKKWTHQGGIAAPFIASWPGGGFRKGEFVRAPHQLVDVVPTILDATGVGIPKDLANHEFRGYSMLDEFRGEREDRDRYLYWEHVGNSAIRRGKFKLVRERHSNWELYNLEEDPTELNNVADDHVDMVREFIAEYERWANAVGVLPWERTERIYREQGLDVIIGGA